LHVASYFLLKGIRSGLGEIFRNAKKAGLTISLDTNDDPEDHWGAEIQSLFPYIDILLLNEREICKIAQTENLQDAVERVANRVAFLVVKRGSQGALARAGKDTYSALPPAVQIVDSVGAGDSFDAGFIHEFIRGQTIEACLKFGNLAAALSVTRPGGTEAFRDELHKTTFLQKYSAG